MYRVLGINNFYAYINCIYLYEKPNIDSDTHGWASAERPRNRVNVNLFLRHSRDLSR